VLAALLLTGCAQRYYVPLPPQSQRYPVTTADGWQLELRRYRPSTPAQVGRPVLLLHGISANARNLDLDAQHSLARWFAAQGRDTWTLSFRGTGESDLPDAAQGRPDGFSFDALWHDDLPAAISRVQQETGAAQLDAVGHSMGGMVLYAYLARGGQGLAAAATLGSPTRLDWGTGTEAALLTLGPLVVDPHRSFPSMAAAHAAAPFVNLWEDNPVERFFINPLNTSPEAWQRLVAYGTADISGGVAQQLLPLIARGAFLSADGSFDFLRGLGEVRTPVLVIAARRDRVAPIMSVKAGYRALGGPKAWRVISCAHGSEREYGHMDLLIGERAASEVWVHLRDFFDAH
jgi:pimeloyl-ACP methyl ester carboxylesterase